jgi:hypothetical protein
MDRLIDNKKLKRIVAVANGKRIVLFEGDNYPENGIFGLTKAKVNKAFDTLKDQ